MENRKNDSLNNSEDIAAFAYRVMGKKQYQAFVLFLLSIYKKVVDYQQKGEQRPFFVVFLTRRCHILKEIFLEVLESATLQKQLQSKKIDLSSVNLDPIWLTTPQINLIYREHFITDFNFLSMSRGFAEYYNLKGELPKFVVVDELLLHGRSMNRLLWSMENAVSEAFIERRKKFFLSEISEREVLCWKEEIRNAFVESVEISVFAKRKGTLLLFSRYAKEKKLSAVEYEGREWRSLSLHFAEVVAASCHNNVGFSWSLNPPVSALPFIKDRYNAEELYWEPEGTDGLPFLQFQRVKTKVRGIDLQNYLKFFVKDHELKGIFSLRIKESLCSINGGKRLMVVPYLMTGRIPRKNAWELFKKLRGELTSTINNRQLNAFLEILPNDLEILSEQWEKDQEEKDTAIFEYDRICGINNLILNCAMVKAFWPQIDLDWNLLSEYIDWLQLNSNYNRFDPETGTLQDQQAALQAIWSWQPQAPLEEYFDILWKDSEGLELSKEELNVSGTVEADVEACVMRVVAKLGLDAETSALQRGKSDVILDEELLTSWGKQYSILEVMNQCRETCIQAGIEHFSFYEIAATIIHLMDLGILGMYTSLDSHEMVYTMVKAGEQSLFVEPIMYRHFIPLLMEIERKYAGDRGAIAREIKSFVQNNSESILKNEKSLILSNSGDSKQDVKPLGEELAAFAEKLWTSGQDVSDWYIALSDQINIVDSNFTNDLRWDVDIQEEYIQCYHQM